MARPGGGVTSGPIRWLKIEVDRHVVSQKPDSPGAQRFVLVVQKAEEERRVRPTDAVQRPESPQLSHGVGILVEEAAEGRPGMIHRHAASGAIGQLPPGLPDKPLVGMPVERDQRGLVLLR